MEIIVDAGPFIHLSQINEIALLKNFPSIHVPLSVISEISLGDDVPIQEICKWPNLKIARTKEKPVPKIEEVIRNFKLHFGERDTLYIANKLCPCIVLTDDLDARNACENLGIKVHGSIGIIAYAFHNKWLSRKKAEESLIQLYRKSSLFVTFAIIEKAIKELRKH